MSMKWRILSLIIIISFSIFISGNNESSGNNISSEKMKTYINFLTEINQNYIKDIDAEDIVETSIEHMLEQLDPYTQYLNIKAYEDLMIGTKGKYGGLGISIGIRDDVLTVISPIEDTPAYRAGVQAGDKIVRIDEEPTEGITIDEAVNTLRGEPGSSVTIGIEREGIDEILEISITRALIELKSVPYHNVIEDGIGYVRLTQFASSTSDELEEALRDMEENGMKKLILDLRGNSGGLLNQAVYVSEKFIGGNRVIVSTKGRIWDANNTIRSQRGLEARDYPLVVLIDEGSASASEIVAGAIQDWDRGVIVGETSFGKGSVQTIVSLDEGRAIKITTARYYTPSGRCIHKEKNEYTKDFYPEAGEAMLTHDIVDADDSLHTTMINEREVIGGGGIVPDIVLQPDSLAPSVRELVAENAFFNFAVHYTTIYPNLKRNFSFGETELTEFKSYLDEQDIWYDAEDIADHQNDIIRLIRQEIAAKLWGTSGRYQEVLKDDKQVIYCLDLLSDMPRYSGILSGKY